MDVLVLTNSSGASFLQQEAAALESRGHSVTTLAVPGDVTPDSPRLATDYIRFYPTVLRHALSGKYDLVHANYGLLAPFALAQPRLPVVLSLWGSDLNGEYGWLSKRCAPHADAVVVMSDEMAATLGQECHVIPHGVDFDRFTPEPQEDARETLGWDHDAYHVLFPYPPGRTVKDFPRAQRIVERLDADERLDRPVELQVVHGVAHDDVPRYMNAADALLLTSKNEGSPNSVKEALACNLPVVSTDVGDVADRLSGVSPSFVGTTDDELCEALVSVLTEGSRSNGREVISHLSHERTTDRLVGVYEQAAHS